MSTSPAKGWTVSDVPMIMSRSHSGRSLEARRWKRSGRASPKKTMSGFTRELHESHVGMELSKMASKKSEFSLVIGKIA